MPPYGLNQNSSPNFELVRTALDKIRDQAILGNARKGKADALDPVIFTQDTATNQAVISTVIGGGGYMEKQIDDLAPNKIADISSPTPKITQMANFKKNVPISYTFMEDQQLSAVNKTIGQQTKTWLASRDRNAFLVYANGFTTQTTIDGVALYSNSHINSNGDTVDNLETGVLSNDNLNTLIVSLRNQLAQTGVKLGYEPDFLLTPNVLHQTGMQVTKSVLRAGTGNNDLNYYSELYPEMMVKYNQFLDDVSTTAYFVGAAGHGVTRFERSAFFTKLIDWETNNQDNYIYKMRAREEVDSIEYSGSAASNGTV